MDSFITLLANDVKQLAGPLVYIYLDQANKPIYIGSSFRGICRALDPHHHIPELPNICSKLQLIACTSEEEARTLEKVLIGRYLPERNIEGKRALNVLKLANEWEQYKDSMESALANFRKNELDIVPSMEL